MTICQTVKNVIFPFHYKENQTARLSAFYGLRLRPSNGMTGTGSYFGWIMDRTKDHNTKD